MTTGRAKPTARKTTAKKTTGTASPRATGGRTEAERTCVGACGASLPPTKFPTYRNKEGQYVRADECRACKAAKRAARKDAR